MWSKRPPQQPYPIAGRILNRHKRGRPRFKLWQRFKSSLSKLFIPAVLISLAFIILFVVNQLGLL